jgi:titin
VNNGESVPSLPLSRPARFTYLAPVKAPLVKSIVGGNTIATVTFINPLIRGAPIIGYAYSTDADGLVYTDISGAVSSPFTITGLTNDISYNIRIAAKTEMGYSPFSVAKPVTPVYKAPEAPFISSIISGNSTLTVSFVVPFENGSPITAYKYTINGGTKIPVVLNPDGKSFIVSKNIVNNAIIILMNGTTYNIGMTAINEVGESILSNVKPGIPTI